MQLWWFLIEEQEFQEELAPRALWNVVRIVDKRTKEQKESGKRFVVSIPNR